VVTSQALADRAYALIEAGRPGDALAITTVLAGAPDASHTALAAHAAALKALGRPQEALTFNRRAAHQYSGSAVAWHNLAGALDDLGQAAEAKPAVERALTMGLTGPDTWLVYAHILTKLMDFETATRAYREVQLRRPADEVAAQELARLLWMTTGDWQAAIAPLEAARAAGAPEAMILLLQGKILESADRREDLHALFGGALQRRPTDHVLMRAAAHAWLEDDDLEKASALAERTLALAPGYVPGLIELAAVRLAQGRSEEALEAARTATRVDPLDQSTWGWLATTARAAGDPAYEQLYDYDALVRSYMIEAPAGWPTLEAYLGDLEQALRNLHRFSTHPADQSLRHGTQTGVELTRSDDPAIKAFFTALDGPLHAYMREIGQGSDPLRSRNTGRYAIQSAWSVLLKPNGFHVNHYHPMGWISSAFYIRTPQAAVDGENREGWIKFGEPPFKTVPRQPPAHFVRPEPGKLVLFPSYMWHGTVPFTTQESRLTIAFDIVPA
jgi:uncharacterized protein (TIGR02466 family)